MKDDKTFASLVAKLNAMGETGEPAKKRQEIKVLKKAKREGKRLHHDANVNAMATLMEAIGKPDVEESKPNHLKGKHKLKSVPAGETDGTTKNPSRGKLVGEENTPIDEDLIASLKTQFRELLEPKKVAEEPTPEAVGEFADPIYDLIDDLGASDNHPVLNDLVRYLDGDTIKDFVADFRRNNDLNHPGEDGDYGEDDKNFESKQVKEGIDDDGIDPPTGKQRIGLEGGYDLNALKESVNCHVKSLLE